MLATRLKRVSILEIHGTQDNVTYFDGDPNNQDNWGAYPSIPATMSFFTDLFGLQLEDSFDFENINTGDGSTVTADKYGAPGSCTQVWLYTVNGGGHDWPGAYGNMDIDSSREAWLFFQEICDSSTDIEQLEATHDRQLVEILDLLGRKAGPKTRRSAAVHLFRWFGRKTSQLRLTNRCYSGILMQPMWIDVKHWDDRAKHVKLLRGNQELFVC